jgi:hypothetical protein
MISIDVDFYKNNFSHTIEAIISEEKWEEILHAPYQKVLPEMLQKLVEEIQFKKVRIMEL